jgi:hypothetical protein
VKIPLDFRQPLKWCANPRKRSSMEDGIEPRNRPVTIAAAALSAAAADFQLVPPIQRCARRRISSYSSRRALVLLRIRLEVTKLEPRADVRGDS